MLCVKMPYSIRIFFDFVINMTNYKKCAYSKVITLSKKEIKGRMNVEKIKTQKEIKLSY